MNRLLNAARFSADHCSEGLSVSRVQPNPSAAAASEQSAVERISFTEAVR